MSLLQALVQLDQEIDRSRVAARAMPREVVARSAASAAAARRYGASSRSSPALVAERELLGVRLEEEVERVEHRHLGDQVDLDAQLARALREDQARQVVGLRVLLPVDEVLAPASTRSE